MNCAVTYPNFKVFCKVFLFSKNQASFMQVVSNFFKENTHKSFVFAASTPFEIQKGNLRE